MGSQYAFDDSQWMEVVAINGYAVFMGYLLMGVRGLGVLILAWTAVVRLGGSVSDLGKKDYWCLTAIMLVQTVGVFEFLLKEKMSAMDRSLWGLLAAIATALVGNGEEAFGWKRQVMTVILLVIQVAVIVITLCLFGVLYLLGLYISAGVSSWRLIEQGFGNEKAPNMKPALEVVYSLAAAQGVLRGYRDIMAWGATKRLAELVVVGVLGDDRPDKEELVAKYIEETVAGCKKNPSFATGRNFVTYGMDMIMEARSNKGFIAGIKILGGTIKNNWPRGRKVLAKHLLTRSDSSMHVIQRLLETVGPRSPYSKEVRAHAARIVAVVASGIRLEQFPGVIECISSVLDPSSAEQESIDELRDGEFDGLYQEYNSRKAECTVRTNFSSIIHDYERVEVLEKYELDCLVEEIRIPAAIGQIQRLHSTDCEMGLLKEAANIIHQLAVDGENRRLMCNTVIRKFGMASLRLHGDSCHDPILDKYWVQWLVAAIKWTNDSQGQTLEESGQPAAAAACGGGERRSGNEVVLEIVEQGWSFKVVSARWNAIDNIKQTIISILDCLECGATQKKQAIQIHLYLSSDMSFIMDTESRRRRLHWILALIYYFPRGDLKWIIGFRNPDAITGIFRRLAHEKLCGRPGAGETETRLALEDLADALSYNTEDISIRTHALIILQDLCSGWSPYMTPHGEELKGILLGLLPKVVEEILIRSAPERQAPEPGMENDVVSEGDVLAIRMSRDSHTDNERLLKALIAVFWNNGSKRFWLMYDAEFKEIISKTCQEKGKSFEHFESLLTTPKQGEEDSHSGTS